MIGFDISDTRKEEIAREAQTEIERSLRRGRWIERQIDKLWRRDDFLSIGMFEHEIKHLIENIEGWIQIAELAGYPAKRKWTNIGLWNLKKLLETIERIKKERR